MRLVDLRAGPNPSAPDVEVRTSSGAELLHAVGALVAAEPSEFDVGAERIRGIRDALPADLLADIDAFGQGDDKTFLVLAEIAAVLDEPADVDELLAALDADPELTWRLLLGHHAQDWAAAPDDLPQRVAAGDEDAIGTVRGLADDGGCPGGVRSLLAHDPVAHGSTVVSIVERFRAAAWEDLESEAMRAIERDAAHRRAQLDAGEPVAAVVLAATNGYELADDPAVRRVVLLPSYWLRPWIVVGRLGDAEVLSTPVADEFLALPPAAPPPALLKLFKALSDEGRLRLLRRIGCGPISLSDAAGELDCAKATAHHHLSILRQAGLVSIRGSGRTTRYALRDDPPAAAQSALADYVRPDQRTAPLPSDGAP